MQSASPYKKTVLKNGLRVITIPRKDDVATTVLVLVEAGSKYETKEINGLSHFLEHMCFKGTVKRPRAIDIAGELDALGAEYNAFTAQEFTGYFAKVEAHKLDQALDIVSDMYLNPTFDPAEIEKEKGVIVEEINMYEDLPNRKINDYFMELLYGDQPAGWDVAGRREVVRAMKRENFLAYRAAHYVPQATVVVAAGGFDEAALLQKIEAAWGAMPAGEKQGKPPVREEQKEPQVFLKTKQVDQVHLVLGCRAVSAFDDRRFALEVLADILGGGMSSRLFQRIREDMGAAYSVRAGTDLFTDHGVIAVNIGADQAKVMPVIAAALEEMARMKTELTPDEELARAKSRLTGRLILGLEASDELASFYGAQEVAGEPIITPQELMRRIGAVTAHEVRAVARAVFTNDRLNLAVIGPIESDAALKAALHF
jgi:predicted Zn-dependent peptidase